MKYPCRTPAQPSTHGRCFMADLLDAAEDDAGAEVPAAAG